MGNRLTGFTARDGTVVSITRLPLVSVGNTEYSIEDITDDVNRIQSSQLRFLSLMKRIIMLAFHDSEQDTDRRDDARTFLKVVGERSKYLREISKSLSIDLRMAIRYYNSRDAPIRSMMGLYDHEKRALLTMLDKTDHIAYPLRDRLQEYVSEAYIAMAPGRKRKTSQSGRDHTKRVRRLVSDADDKLRTMSRALKLVSESTGWLSTRDTANLRRTMPRLKYLPYSKAMVHEILIRDVAALRAMILAMREMRVHVVLKMGPSLNGRDLVRMCGSATRAVPTIQSLTRLESIEFWGDPSGDWREYMYTRQTGAGEREVVACTVPYWKMFRYLPSRLRSLTVVNGVLDDTAINHISNLSSLRTLRIESDGLRSAPAMLRVTVAGMESLSKLTSLTELRICLPPSQNVLPGDDGDDYALHIVSRAVPGLVRLSTEGWSLTTLRSLTDCKSLRHLSVARNHLLTNDSFASLVGSGIQSLDISSCTGITDCSTIAQFEQLSKLHMNRLSAGLIPSLRGLDTLRDLSVRNAATCARGVIPQLADLKLPIRRLDCHCDDRDFPMRRIDDRDLASMETLVSVNLGSVESPVLEDFLQNAPQGLETVAVEYIHEVKRDWDDDTSLIVGAEDAISGSTVKVIASDLEWENPVLDKITWTNLVTIEHRAKPWRFSDSDYINHRF